MDNSFKLRCSQSQQPVALYSLLSCLMLLSGCTSSPAISALLNQDLPQTDQSGLYQQTPVDLSAEQLQSRFKKIAEFIQTGKSALAKNAAEEIDKAMLSPEQLNQYNLLYSQIMLSFGEAEHSLDRLNNIQPEQLNTEEKITYYQSQAFAHSLSGNRLESAKSRIILNQLLTDTEQYNKNQAAILETLNLLPDSTLLDPYQAQNDTDLAGWMNLAWVLKLKGQPNGNFNAELAKWRETFPDHSGNTAILNSSLPIKTAQKLPEYNYQQPNSIALFLPETGAYAQAGKAIRAGFMAAYNSPVNNVKKPSYSLYNSEQSSLTALYNQAVAEGANLIIGPLSKESIQNLADTTTLTIPVLALNHIPSLQKDNLYQFGLSPMDDVAEITNKAWLDGHKKTLLLTPENELGTRIAGYFQQEWQRLDGTILDSQSYSPKKTDFSDTIKKLLNINESEYRYQKIAEILPSVVFMPRRREDVDVLFLGAHSDQARLINAQLQLYHASGLPVYAMPNVYTGLVDPAKDEALNNITFCDTPWVFDSAYSGDLSMNALRATWESFPSSYLRLIAMGIDAYHLASKLNTRDIDNYPGATGKLTLTPDDRIKRSLTCAKFINGQPSIMGSLAEPTTSTQPETNYTISNVVQ